MSKNNSATKGFAVLSAAGILNKVLSVIYIPLLLHIVGDVGYGIYQGGYRIYSFIYILTNSGFPIGIAKLQAELIAHQNYRDAKRSFRIIQLAMATYGLFMSAMTILFANQISIALGYERSYKVILALAPTMFFASISCSFRGFYNGSSNMKPTAMSQVIEQFLNVTLSLIFALVLTPFGIEWACAGATVGTTLGSLGSALYLKSAFKNNRSHLDNETPADVRPLPGRVILKRLLSYAVPIAFNSIVVFGGDLVDLWNTKKRLLAANFTDAQSYISYGVLGKYTQLLNVPLAITAAMYIAVMPSFSRAIALKDNRLLKSHIGEAFKTSLMISIPAAVGLGVLSKPVFLLLFSEKYLDGWNLMAMGSIVIILVSIVQIQGGVLQAVNKTRLSTISLLAGILAKILINYFLISIPSINIKGAVIGTIVCYIVAIYINSKYIKKFVPVRISIKKHMGRPIIASAAMAVTAGASYKLLYILFNLFAGDYMSNAAAALLAIAIGVLTYGIVMLRIGGITFEDLETLPYGRRIMKYIPKHILSMANPKL